MAEKILVVEDDPAVLQLVSLTLESAGYQVISPGPQGRLPILMLSANSQEADRAMGDRMGADLYLPKPAAPEETTASVLSLLPQREDRDA
jgi:DNA-binding response OmpR family regulator